MFFSSLMIPKSTKQEITICPFGMKIVASNWKKLRYYCCQGITYWDWSCAPSIPVGKLWFKAKGKRTILGRLIKTILWFLRVTEVISQRLDFICTEIVLIPKNVIVCRTTCSLRIWKTRRKYSLVFLVLCFVYYDCSLTPYLDSCVTA